MTNKNSTEILSSDSFPVDIKLLLDHTFDGIMICDGQGRTIYVNKPLADMHGMTPYEFIKKSTDQLLNENMISYSLVQYVLKNKISYTKKIFLKSGKSIYSTAIPILNDNGEIHRIIINARDITDIINLEKKFKQSVWKIEKYKQQLNDIKLSSENSTLPFIPKSKQMLHVWDIAMRAANSSATVLLYGETGSGKEIMARAIHINSKLSKNPFVAVNCSAIPESLIEAELFGYEKGAFTDAYKQKIGIFEEAQHGTLLLDEISELSLPIQVKLLRVLQERKIRRIGGKKIISLDIRIIAASNKKLDKLVEEGKFRQDLFYRLNVIQINIPPLRECPEDVSGFIWYFLKKFTEYYKSQHNLHPSTVHLLCSYDWPGNIRELENTMERLVVLCPNEEIDPSYLPSVFFDKKNIKQTTMMLSLKDTVERQEKEYLLLLSQQFPSLRKIAEVAGCSHTTIARKLKKYGIPIIER